MFNQPVTRFKQTPIDSEDSENDMGKDFGFFIPHGPESNMRFTILIVYNIDNWLSILMK